MSRGPQELIPYNSLSNDGPPALLARSTLRPPQLVNGGTSAVGGKDPVRPVSAAAWQRIAADMERLAVTNDDLQRSLEELQRTCREAVDENARLRKLLSDHNVSFDDPTNHA